MANGSKAAAKLKLFLFLIWLLGSVSSPSSRAQDTNGSDSATLAEKIQIPVEVQGKKVGTTTLAAGTKVSVVAREGDRVSVKHGSLEPVWIKESQLSGLSPRSAGQAVSNSSTDPTANLAKLKVQISAENWIAVAQSCEALANESSGKFAALAELGKQLKSSLQARVAAANGKVKAEKEAQRLRRNAEVAGEPSALNPNDNSPMERAQKYREQADAVIEEANTALEESEAQIRELADGVSSMISSIDLGDATAPHGLLPAPDASLKHSEGEQTTARDSDREPTTPDAVACSEYVVSHAYESLPETNEFRRGPKIHGIQLGMTFEELVSALNQAVPGLTVRETTKQKKIDSTDDAVYEVFNGDRSPVHEGQFLLGTGEVGFSTALGGQRVVIMVFLSSSILAKMFNLDRNQINSEEFCQRMIDSYGIPRLRGKGNDLVYYSPEGWAICFSYFPYPSSGLSGMRLAITKPETIDHGFGR